MSEERFRLDLARLQAALAIADAQVMANPKKYLSRMSRHCVDLLDVLERVEHALSPDIVFDFAEERNMRPADINGEALIRCNAAKRVLRDYKITATQKEKGDG